MHTAPGTLLYLPAPHAAHLALPFVSEDWPASQSEQFQDPEFPLTLPAAHLWHAFVMPVSLPNSPGKHGRHEAWPIDFW